jgi:hypothetical protein
MIAAAGVEMQMEVLDGAGRGTIFSRQKYIHACI